MTATYPRWPLVGRGASRSLQALSRLTTRARSRAWLARGKKTVEGRPGGGWLKNVQTDDIHINFQVAIEAAASLSVRVLRVTYHDL